MRRLSSFLNISVWPTVSLLCSFFFFNDTATTEIYTLSLHDALPISAATAGVPGDTEGGEGLECSPDRKSTRLNSSHQKISYAVFCLKKKNKNSNVMLFKVVMLEFGVVFRAAILY